MALIAAIFISGIRSSSIPGPTWVMPLLQENIELTQDLMLFLMTRMHRYGKMFRVYLFGHEFIVIADWPKAKRVFTARQANFALPVNTARQVLATNSFRSSEDQAVHPTFRKHMQQALSPLNLRNRMVPRMVPVLTRHVDNWFQASSSGPIAIDSLTRNATIEVAFGAVAGFELDQAQMDQVTDYALTVQRGLFAAPINFPGTFFAKALSTKAAYMTYLESLLRARFEINAETGGIVLPPVQEGNLCGTTASIQEMIELGEVPKPEALVHKLMVNAVGASETTGGIMFSSILASACVMGLMQKLRVEQRDAISKHGPTINYDTLQSMTLLDAVVREACRVIPSAHVLFRILLEDLELDDVVLHKGSKVVLPLPIFAALDEAASGGEEAIKPGSLPSHIDHRNLDRAFQPEKNWMEGKPRPLLPVFGYGTHACLGQSLAIAELKITLALMLRKGTWTFEGQGPPSFQFLPMLRLNSGPALVKFTLHPL